MLYLSYPRRFLLRTFSFQNGSKKQWKRLTDARTPLSDFAHLLDRPALVAGGFSMTFFVNDFFLPGSTFLLVAGLRFLWVGLGSNLGSRLCDADLVKRNPHRHRRLVQLVHWIRTERAPIDTRFYRIDILPQV